MTKNLVLLFERDLEKLSQEISAFPNDQSLWRVAADIKNSAGNLCLHLNGNLNHFIGAQMGNTGYVRNREAEFNTRTGTRQELVSATLLTRQTISNVIRAIPIAQLDDVYPEELFGYQMTYGYFLIHLYGHLNYHLGQINYCRRLLK